MKATIHTLAIAFSLTFFVQADKPHTPKPGSKARKAICDAVRVADSHSSHKFVVQFLRIDGDWAGFVGKPEGLDATYTALLHRGQDKKWKAVTFQSHGDVPTSASFTGGKLVPLSVYPDIILRGELESRELNSD